MYSVYYILFKVNIRQQGYIQIKLNHSLDLSSTVQCTNNLTLLYLSGRYSDLQAAARSAPQDEDVRKERVRKGTH